MYEYLASVSTCDHLTRSRQITSAEATDNYKSDDYL